MPQVNAGQRVTGALLSENYALSDTSVFTVTAATNTQMSKYWTIPANDAQPGTGYRLTVFGGGSVGTTSETQAYSAAIDGVAVGTNPTIGSAQFGASVGFRFWVQIVYLFVTIGSSGTYYMSITGNASITGSALLTNTGSQGSIGFASGTTGTATLDTTVAHTAGLLFAFGNTTGAPSNQSVGSIFERLGG